MTKNNGNFLVVGAVLSEPAPPVDKPEIASSIWTKPKPEDAPLVLKISIEAKAASPNFAPAIT